LHSTPTKNRKDFVANALSQVTIRDYATILQLLKKKELCLRSKEISGIVQNWASRIKPRRLNKDIISAIRCK
jgi:hypothetical protein